MDQLSSNLATSPTNSHTFVHMPISFDPLKMDYIMLVAVTSWVMEELTRLYLTNDEGAAKVLVESPLVKDNPLVEEIESDRLILRPGLAARVQLEILLYREYPKRHPLQSR